MTQVMTIGKLVSIEILDPKTKRTTKQKFNNKWLVTKSGNDISIATVTGRSNQRVNPAQRKRHQRFHNTPPKGLWKGELIEPVGQLQQVGLLKALTYSVPGSKIKSPEKNPYHWHHSFGDTGHRGGAYPESVMPAVYKDSKGNYFFKRRKGNIFKVTDWIRG